MSPFRIRAQKNEFVNPSKKSRRKKIDPIKNSPMILFEKKDLTFAFQCAIITTEQKERSMKNPLIINIRCSCIEEYINLQRLHKEYTRQLRTGEIMSVFVGADMAVPGEYEVVDKLLEKKNPVRQVPCVDFGDRKVEVADIRSITKEFTKEDFEELKKEVDERSVVMAGPQPDEEIALPQAVDGGVDAMGNSPLPESGPVLPEAHGQPVSEFAIGDRAEEFHYEEEPVSANLFPGPAVEVEVHKSFKHVPETLDNDVPAYVGTEPFQTFGPQEFNQAAPSVAEESDDGNGQDYNTTYAG